MNEIVVKQPNGLYCLFSVDERKIIEKNMSRDALIRYFTIQAFDKIKNRIRNTINNYIDRLDTEGGELTYDEALRLSHRNDPTFEEVEDVQEIDLEARESQLLRDVGRFDTSGLKPWSFFRDDQDEIHDIMDFDDEIPF